jgi:hypothetical protein
MRAARQGTFDGLCGIYAIINSLDLVGLKGRRCTAHAELFKQLTYALGAAALLSAMREGLEAKELVRAAEVAFGWLSTTYGPELSISQPYLDEDFKTVGQYVHEIGRYCEAWDAAAIISVKMPNVSHWTVPRAVVGDRILLRDSDGLSELRATNFTLRKGLYRFRPSDTLVIQRS